MFNHAYKTNDLNGEIFDKKQYQRLMYEAANIIQTKYKSCSEQSDFIRSHSNEMVQLAKDCIQDEDDIDSNLNIGAIVDDKERNFAIEAMNYFKEHGDWENIRSSILNKKRCLEGKIFRGLNSYDYEYDRIQKEIDNTSINLFNSEIKKDSFCATLETFLGYEFDNAVIKSACLDLMCRDYYAFLQDKNLVIKDAHEIAKLIFYNKQNNFDDKIAVVDYLSKKSKLNGCLSREFIFLFLDNIELISPVEQVIFFERFSTDMRDAVNHRMNKIKEAFSSNKYDVAENYNVFSALIEFLARKLIAPGQFIDCIKKFDGQKIFSEKQSDVLLDKVVNLMHKSIVSADDYIKIANAIKPIDIFKYYSAHNYLKLTQLISDTANLHNLLEPETKLDQEIIIKYKNIYLNIEWLDVVKQWFKNFVRFILKGEDCACRNYEYLKADAAVDKLESVLKESLYCRSKSYKKNNFSIPQMASSNITHGKNLNRIKSI